MSPIQPFKKRHFLTQTLDFQIFRFWNIHIEGLLADYIHPKCFYERRWKVTKQMTGKLMIGRGSLPSCIASVGCPFAWIGCAWLGLQVCQLYWTYHVECFFKRAWNDCAYPVYICTDSILRGSHFFPESCSNLLTVLRLKKHYTHCWYHLLLLPAVSSQQPYPMDLFLM